MPPSLILYNTPKEYLDYYKNEFCKNKLITHDGIRVYFPESKFWHAFCTRDSNGKKNEFSQDRAKYISWIRPTLENPKALLLQGWNADTQKYEPHRRVSILYEDFMVVLEVKVLNNNSIKANFITSFYITGKSAKRLKESPQWRLDECIKAME